ncbi:MAG: hypothetical protein QXI16_00525 [Sulfolobaceae archaeon]
MKINYIKKVSLLFLVIPILLLTIFSKPIKATYVILDNIPFNFFYDIEMVYSDQPAGSSGANAKAYILISWNKYLNEDTNPFYMRAYHIPESGYFDTSYQYTTTYRSPDYVQQSQTFVQNQFINWFGVGQGTIYSQYFTILEIVGGTDIPPMDELAFVIYANRGGLVSIDYTASVEATTDPTVVFDRYITLEAAGYNQGYADNDVDVQVIRNQIRAEELAKYARDRDEYEEYIDYLILQLDTETDKAFDEGFEEGLIEGATLNDQEIYDEAYAEGLKVGSNNKFYDNIEKWLVPAIIVVMFSGGILLVFRKRSDD